MAALLTKVEQNAKLYLTEMERSATQIEEIKKMYQLILILPDVLRNMVKKAHECGN